MIIILKLEIDSKTKRKKHTQPLNHMIYILRVLVIMNCKFKTYVFLIVPLYGL